MSCSGCASQDILQLGVDALRRLCVSRHHCPCQRATAVLVDAIDLGALREQLLDLVASWQIRSSGSAGPTSAAAQRRRCSASS